MTQQCFLHSAINIHDPILLPNQVEIIVGRGDITKITEKRCSRRQVSLTANTDLAEVSVKQIGDNKAGINGFALKKNETYTLKDGDRLELLFGEHIYQVEFKKDTNSNNGSLNGVSQKRQQHSPESPRKKMADSSSTGKRSGELVLPAKPTLTLGGLPKCAEGSWETVDKGKLLIFTPHGLEGKKKIASYDLDHTVITTKSGNVFPKDVDDWKIAFNEVPGKLKQLWRDGYKIVFFTNQAGISRGKVKTKDFKTKVIGIISKLGVPVQAFVSTGSGIYRKPAPGMWNVLLEQMNDSVKVDVQESFYCGDAAGRVANWAPKKKKDFSSSDRLFALNVGVTFYTPEEHFLNQRPAEFAPPEFSPASLSIDTPLCEPATASITLKKQEAVILVGYPGSGKSFFSETHMIPAGYSHVNRDTLGSRQRCLAAMETALKGGKSVVVDNTNPDRASRREFVETAKKLDVACRCFVLSTTKEHSKHNNKFREFTDDSHQPVNDMIINMYRTKYEEPTLEEGFGEIVKINFVPKFNKPDLEKLYRMYLLDGKR